MAGVTKILTALCRTTQCGAEPPDLDSSLLDNVYPAAPIQLPLEHGKVVRTEVIQSVTGFGLKFPASWRSIAARLSKWSDSYRNV